MKNMIVYPMSVDVQMRQDKRLDKPQWTEHGRYYARRVAAVSASEQVDVMICKYCGESKSGPFYCKRYGHIEPNPHMVNESREAFARGNFMTTEELLEDIRKRKFMEENGLGAEDMELDI